MKQGWEIKKLKDISVLITDGDWIESRHQSDDGIRLIQTGNIGNGIFRAKDAKSHYISEETFNELGCTEIFSGDCLVSRLPEPVGRACIIPELDYRMITAVDCTIIRFKDFILPKFFVYYSQCSKYLRDINNSTTGTTRKRISRKNLESVTIPIPSILEQEKIVAELDCLSGIIEKKKQQLKEYDALAQSIFYEMFGNPIDNEKGWEMKKLGEVCDVRDGTHDSPKYLEQSDFVLITSKNIVGNTIDFTSANHISEDDYININKRSCVDDGDIIMAMIGTIGNPIIVKDIDRKFCIKNVALIKFAQSTLVTNVYIRALLDNKCYYQYIQSQNKGGTQKFVALGTVRNFTTPIPPLSLQQEFASKIEAIEKQKELIKQSIAETETLFYCRMDFYFN